MRKEMEVMMVLELVESFIEAHTREDQKILAMVGAYAISHRGVAVVNIPSGRSYTVLSDDDTISLRTSRGVVYTFPIEQAKKFIAALGQYANSDFADSKRRYTYKNKMVSAIAG